MGAEPPVVPVIVGPTAVGKTALVLALGDLVDVEVISADSRQVYRGLDVGTAKPSAAERERLPHHGIDCVDPGEKYSAGQFHEDAAGWIGEVRQRALPVVVGGTGLYVRALAEGIFGEPPLDATARDQLRSWIGEQGNLQRWAGRLDPGYQPGGIHRTSRAIEIALLTGRPLSWWHRESGGDPVIIPWYVRMTLPRAALLRRIEARVDRMLSGGMIEETERLLATGLDSRAAGLDALGYRDVTRYIAGAIGMEELRRAIVIGTRQYAKRQETWFRNQLPDPGVLVVDALEDPTTNARFVAQKWAERRNS